MFAHTQMGVALLHLEEVEQFVDEFEHHARILIDTLQASGYSGALLYILHHIVELCNDERERRAELVRYAREELQLCLVESLLVLTVFLLDGERRLKQQL